MRSATTLASLLLALVLILGFTPIASAYHTTAEQSCISLMEEKKYAEAEPHCVKAADESGMYGAFLLGCLRQSQGDFKSAVSLYDRALKEFDLDSEFPSEHDLMALNNRLLARIELGDREGASKDIEAMYWQDPDNVEIVRQAITLTTSNEMRLVYTERLVEMEPRSAESHLYRARALEMSGNRGQALKSVETALSLDPKMEAALEMQKKLRATK